MAARVNPPESECDNNEWPQMISAHTIIRVVYIHNTRIIIFVIVVVVVVW